jgi:predicted aldo/keto reductase-like oxidoreductase
MRYRADKRSGARLSALGFGCMRFHRNLAQIDYKRAEKLIVDAVDAGVNYFDTAYLYFGSEEVLGRALAENGLREKVYIATKLPLMLCRAPEDFERLFSSQLEKLKTDHIDYYLMHNMQDMATWNRLKQLGIEDWLAEKKAARQVGQVGFSFHGVQSEFMALLNAYDWDFCQIQYNYVNENYQAGKAGLIAAAEKGLPVIVMEPLLGGKLAEGLPKKAEALFKQASLAASPAEWALKWLWNQPEVTVALSGMNSPEQLDENVKAAESSQIGMFGESERTLFENVEKAFRESYKVPCTGCNYCMPCPKNVNIPGCFATYNLSYATSFFAGMTMYFQDVTKRSPRQCVKCGQCEKHCPQHIKIMDELESVKKRMEPWWLKPALAIFRAVQAKTK